MMNPLPADDPQRLEAMQHYQILGTEPEAAFDRITKLAARVFEVPIAFVSLVHGEEQWFKSCYGLDKLQTPREISFCSHTILADEILEVPDATQDERFAGSALVTGPPHVRFYAGVPLLVPGGFKLGTLCLMDTKPRTLSPEQRATLSDMAAMVVDEMETRLTAKLMRDGIEELRHYQQALKAAEESAHLTVETAHDAFVSMDAAGLITGWNRRAEAIFGWPREEVMGRPVAETIIPPSFREAHRRGLKKFLETGQGPVLNQIFEITAVRRDGTEFPVELSISPLRLGESYLFTAFVRDISQRKQSDELLARQAVAFQEQAELLDLAHESIIVADFDGTITFWNKGAERMHGWTRAEAIGQDAHGLLRVQLPRPLEELKELLLRDGSWEGEAIYISRDGTPITVATRWVLKRDARGRAAAILKISNDITARKAAETALQESRRFAQAVADQSTSLIYVIDLETRRNVYSNRDAAAFLGYTPAQVKTLDSDFFLNIIHPDDRARAEAHFGEFGPMSDEDTLEYEQRIRDANGQWHTLLQRERVFRRRPDGSPQEIMGTAIDITARKEAEAQLQTVNDQLENRVARRTDALAQANVRLHESADRLQAILDNATAVVYLKDLGGRYLLVNRQFETLLNAPREQLIGKTDYDLFPADMADILAANDQKMLAANGVLEIEEEMLQPDGLHTFISVKVPLRDADGKIYAVCGISTDITERKRAEVALQAAKEEAERANAAKSELLSRTSHELRTPLNAILGFGQLLQLDELSADQTRSVEQILKAGRHQLELVDRVLDVARIETRKLEIALEPVAVGEVLREALEVVRSLAEAQDVQLHLDASATRHAALRMMADRARLGQVLLILLSNAVKYNHMGGNVTVSAARVENSNRLRLAVEDTGSGLTPEQTARLFRLFDRIDAEEAGVKGTGIGLTLAKGLTEAMGGDIGVQSRLGEGSTFWIELPLASGEALQEEKGATGAAAQTVPENQPVVLYIEDNLSNLTLIEQILRQRPEIKLLTAMQGGMGLELARLHRPSLILLDLHLPDIQGDEVLRRLQGDAATREIPVVIVSADAMPHQIEQLRAAGARDYLTKPLDVKRFLEVLDAQLL